MNKMAVRNYNGHFYKSTREVCHIKIQEYVNRTLQVKTMAVNTYFCEEKQEVGLFASPVEALRVPQVVRVPQFGNHCITRID